MYETVDRMQDSDMIGLDVSLVKFIYNALALRFKDSEQATAITQKFAKRIESKMSK